ncbi:glycerophosphodiester phosphodiesterase [Paenibacillus whitsoniae]|uniref:Glycerophosphodiester phosphodiesterase n=1 Tax=Paenibacillus whitsoniae TaxID=2496558 RepID=A0A3S0BXP5_9BACL|nr:glycerophosphodiester phosphodiesterase [Paenibacillus whitsoniae]RTE10647.1 glycerophosphodiester phosphodiesterase [Paenibacillus whitsoniae]
MKPFPLITAHTGCMGTPANSRLSIETAFRSGADIVEDDIRVTADGVLVLAHDDRVAAVEGTAYSIAQTRYADIETSVFKAPDGKSNEAMRLLPLASVLPLLQASGARMNLDLKSDACIEPVSRMVDEHDLYDKVLLSGCEASRARLVQRSNPRLRKLLNVDPALFQANAYGDAAHWSCEDARSANCFGINVNYRLVQPDLLEIAAQHQLDVYVWTVDEQEAMKPFVEMGVQSITSRNVQALIALKQLKMGDHLNDSGGV